MRLIFLFALCLGGCSNHLVRCDTHLQPINNPAAIATDAATGHVL
jgi:hypothetical protein